MYKAKIYLIRARSNKLLFSGILTLLLLLLSYTAISKIIAYDAYKEEFANTILGKYLPESVYSIVPTLEIAIIGLLLIPSLRTLGLYSSAIFLFGTALYILYIMTNVHDIPCACGGFFDQLPKGPHFLINLAFASLATFAIKMKPANKATP